MKMDYFLYNDNIVRVDEENKAILKKYGSIFARGAGNSSLSFDPKISIASRNPFPFSIGGYIMELVIGG